MKANFEEQEDIYNALPDENDNLEDTDDTTLADDELDEDDDDIEDDDDELLDDDELDEEEEDEDEDDL